MALLSSAASADWSNKVGLNAKVHDHKFDRVALSGEGCALTFKLGFNAPHKAYKSRVKARNSYLFRARAQLKSGKQFETQVFRSGSAARRTFTQRFDTDGEGCWGKEKLQVIDVKVVGCRGKGCKVPDFE
jgi:hypothetical protein